MIKRFLIKKIIRKIIFSILFLSFFHTLQTLALEITKINYTASNNDNRWVEIFNNGTDILDFTSNDYKLLDSKKPDTKHSILELLGGVAFPASSTIYISPTKDIPVEGATSFRSNYSLDKTSGFIAITDSGGSIYTCLAYGEGICPESAKPKEIESEEKVSSSTKKEETTKVLETIKYIYVPQNNQDKYGDIQVLLPEEKTVLALADTNFIVRAVDSSKHKIEDLNYHFSFGDGGEAKNKAETSYSYTYPGEYRLVASAEGFLGGAKALMKVKVIEPNIKILKVGLGGQENFIDIENNTDADLFLSHFYLKINGKEFELPKNLLIAKRQIAHLSGEALGFQLPAEEVSLLYPNHNLLTKYMAPSSTISFQYALPSETLLTENSSSALKLNKEKTPVSLETKGETLGKEVVASLEDKREVGQGKDNTQAKVLLLKRLILGDALVQNLKSDSSLSEETNKLSSKEESVDIGLIKWFRNLLY